MLEKLGTPGFERISEADPVVLRLLQDCLTRTSSPVIYEIGVGIGATTLELARHLDNRGELYLFSREHDVAELTNDLRALGYSNVNGSWGSPKNTFSGYHFQLALGYCRRELPTFDMAYLDGGHVFHLDAPAASVLKELCNPRGYLVFDDWSWSLGKSATVNPRARPATAIEFDQQQIETCHIQLVCRAIMDTDARFRFLGIESDSAVYQRLP